MAEVTQGKKFVRNVTLVVISNLLTLLSGILSGFLVPKIMGVTEYGFFKTFALYSSYVGVFHFGFIDGILLKYAGKDIDKLDKNHFRLLSRFMMVFETIIAAIGAGVSLLFLPNNLKLIFLFVALNLLGTNMTTYFEYIVQITMNFKQLSIRSVIRTSIQVLVVGVLCLLFFAFNVKIEPFVYIGIIVAINFLLFFWYLITYRDFVFGQSEKFSFNKISEYFKYGFPLLCSNLVVMLILAIDQIFVNVLFDTETYAYYAFAYSMISLITTATNAISTVLFPTLKKKEIENQDDYSKFSSYMLIFAALCLLAYQVFVFIVTHFLEKYESSLIILRIIIATVLVTSPISVVKYNFYKKKKMVIPYFIISAIILAISIGADIAMYYIYKNTISISIVSIAVCFVWYIVVDLYYSIKFKQKWLKNFLFLVIGLGGYYGSTFIPHNVLSFFAYFAFIVLIILAFYFKELKEIFQRKKITPQEEKSEEVIKDKQIEE